MCGRYVSPEQAEIERLWHIGRHNLDPFGRRFNVSPASPVPALLLNRATGQLELVIARWGLIPVWWKEPKPPRMTHNARSEEATIKPMWKSALGKSRCLIPALGWYEWKQVERTDPATGEIIQAKQPYFLHVPQTVPFAFAGLIALRRAASDAQWEASCAILTRDAVGPAAEVHDRMPVLLSKGQEHDWLDARITDPAQAMASALGTGLSALVYHPVSSRVNISRNDDAGLVEKVGE